ncbi:hypothetical protein phiOC_p205 [Ochrobactrum phage vB_OspM_OC]|nr:hypothetical protein phiOC_p205 [Ochrobactrum phage vB_OspM_OC]
MFIKVDYNSAGEIIHTAITQDRSYHQTPYEFKSGDIAYILSVTYPTGTKTIGVYKDISEANSAKLSCISIGVMSDNKPNTINAYPHYVTPIESIRLSWDQETAIFAVQEREL